MEKRNNIEILYNISLSIGKSLDLQEVLHASLGSFSSELDLFGSAVFFFRVDSDSNIFLERVYASPDDSLHEIEYSFAVENLLTFPDMK